MAKKKPQSKKTNKNPLSDFLSEGWQWRLGGALSMVILALIALFLYFKPATDNKTVLMQNDILQGKGMSKDIADFRKANKGEEPLWNSSMFGGMPAYQVSTLYPNNLFQQVDKVMKLKGFLPHPIGHFFLLFLGMLVFLMTLKIDPFLSALGAFGFCLSSYFFIAMEAGHNSKINALAYVPFVLAGVLMIYRGRWLLGGALTAFFLALEINANHFQITYYMMFIIGGIVLSELVGGRNFGKAFSLVMSGLIAYYTLAVSETSSGMDSALALALLGGVIGWIGYEYRTHGFDLKISGADLKKYGMRTGVFIAAFLLAVGPNIGRLQTTAEYGQDSIRGKPALKSLQAEGVKNKENKAGLNKDYAYQWSYGVGETFTLLNPYYMGDASNSDVGEGSETHNVLKRVVGGQAADALSQNWPTYFGDQPFTSGPVYIGAVICFLFILGMVVLPDRYKWWLFGATMLSIFLSWGKNWQWFSDLFFDNFPMYNRFRAVSMLLVIAEITMPIMAVLAVHRIFTNPEKWSFEDIAKKVGIAGGITAAILLVMLVAAPGTNDFAMPSDGQRITSLLGRAQYQPDPTTLATLTEALESDRQSMFTAGIMRSFLFVLLAGAVVLGYHRFIKPRVKMKNPLGAPMVGGLILVALVMGDMIPINMRYLDHDDFVKKKDFLAPFRLTTADQAVLRDPDPNYRVLNMIRNPWQDGYTPYHHKSIGGYHAAKLRRYQDLIDFQLDPEFKGIVQIFRTGKETIPQDVQNLLAQGAPAMRMMNCKYIIYNQSAPPFVNQSAMGHAWIVGGYDIVEGPDEAIQGIRTLDVPNKIIVEKSDADAVNGFTPQRDPAASIQLTSYKLNHLTYAFNAPSGREQLAVFSEIYYNSGKGWNAYVDGKPVDHFRCNYVLRAMRVPGGQHTVEFKFEPSTYARGETIALLCSLLLFGALIGAVYFDNKWDGAQMDEESESLYEKV